MPVAIGDVYETRVITSCQGQIGINVRQYLVDDIVLPGDAEPVDLAESISVNIQSTYRALMTAQALFHGVSVQRIHPAPVQAVYYSDNLGIAGTVTGDALPTQIAGLLQLRAPMPGRTGYLRSFHPFPAEADSDVDGLPTAGYITRLNAMGDLYLSLTTPAAAGRAGFTLKGCRMSFLTGLPVTLNFRKAMSGWSNQRRRSFYGKKNDLPF